MSTTGGIVRQAQHEAEQASRPSKRSRRVLVSAEDEERLKDIDNGALLWTSRSNWGGLLVPRAAPEEVIGGISVAQYHFFFKGCKRKLAPGDPPELLAVEGVTLFSGYHKLYRATLVPKNDSSGDLVSDGGEGIMKKAWENLLRTQGRGADRDQVSSSSGSDGSSNTRRVEESSFSASPDAGAARPGGNPAPAVTPNSTRSRNARRPRVAVYLSNESPAAAAPTPGASDGSASSPTSASAHAPLADTSATPSADRSPRTPASSSSGAITRSGTSAVGSEATPTTDPDDRRFLAHFNEVLKERLNVHFKARSRDVNKLNSELQEVKTELEDMKRQLLEKRSKLCEQEEELRAKTAELRRKDNEAATLKSENDELRRRLDPPRRPRPDVEIETTRTRPRTSTTTTTTPVLVEAAGGMGDDGTSSSAAAAAPPPSPPFSTGASSSISSSSISSSSISSSSASSSSASAAAATTTSSSSSLSRDVVENHNDDDDDEVTIVETLGRRQHLSRRLRLRRQPSRRGRSDYSGIRSAARGRARTRAQMRTSAPSIIHVDDMTHDQLLQAFGTGTENQGADAAQIAALPVSTIGDVEKELPGGNRQCMVCLQDFAQGEQRKLLPCVHGYHVHCIDPWLRSIGTCPVCKNEVKDTTCPSS